MSDFGESGRQLVEEKFTDELHGRKGNGVAPFCGELDDIVLHGDEAVVGDGHFVGVSAEIVEDLLRTAERDLGIDIPALLVQGCQQVRGQGGLFGVVGPELSRGAGFLEEAQDLASKEGRHDVAGKEVAGGVRTYPGITRWSQAACGDDTVDVRVESQVPCPGMQHAGDGRHCAEVVRVGRQSEQGL